jgi:hypothetical protein
VLFLSSSGAGTLSPALAALLGILTAGTIHVTKATARPVVTLTTAGLGNPIVSIVEDVLAIVGSLLAIFAPLLVGLFLIALVVGIIWLRRRRRARAVRQPQHYATG